MFHLLDSQTRLTRRQILLAIIAAWAVCLEFLDYFIIGFILTFVAGPWGLNYIQSSVILLSSGVGAIFGAIFFGRLADRIGRRKVFLSTIVIFSAGTLALAATPDDPTVGWIFLTVFRVVIGMGAGGLYVVDLPLVQEYMPISKRGRITGLVSSTVPVGFLLGSLLIWLLSDLIGWRGILLLAAALGFMVLLLRLAIPESPRYLAQQGDVEGARRSVAWALQLSLTDIPSTIDLAASQNSQQSRMRDLLSYPRSFWASTLSNIGMQTGYYGLALWTPTLLVLAMDIDSSQGGFYMIFVTLGALAGRFAFSYLSDLIGRRITGVIASGGAVVLVITSALTTQMVWAGLSAFFVMMVLTYFFGEGGFAIVGPYSGEVWPSHLRTTGMGFAYGIGGIGKILGPLGLALILGAEDLVKPGATEQNLLPGFSYFAAWYALVAIAFIFFGIETRNKPIEELDRELELQRKR